MLSATIDACHAPAAPLRGDRWHVLRGLRVAALAAALAAPFVAAEFGGSGSVTAGIAIPSIRQLAGEEIQPMGDAGDPLASGIALEPARPFIASYGDAASALRAETCLTEAIYYEGALESETGQRAIAQVVLNRVRHPAYPDSVCGVVFQGQERSTGCQFTFTCDGSRARPPVPNLWARANRIAKAALGGSVAPEVGLSTHYHADYVNPYWSASLDSSGQIGSHLFYRWRGMNGKGSSFTMRYSGREPEIAAFTPRSHAVGSTPGDGGAEGRGEAPTGLVEAFVPAPPAPAPVPFRARPLRLANEAADTAQ